MHLIMERIHLECWPGSARSMGDHDIWIAATASVLKATLLTTDHDFDHLDGHFCEVIYIDPQ
ncbi:MAG TPA: hypothetical protein DCZ95_18740 [Verrucomicrobia bacterium]|nr:hypothetical protein [Verrucomicrobiota bacterium]